MDYKIIGARIKEAREARGMPQREFAKKMGLSQTYISAFENGHRSPSIDVLEKMGEVLKKKLAYFIG